MIDWKLWSSKEQSLLITDFEDKLCEIWERDFLLVWSKLVPTSLPQMNNSVPF